MGIMENEKKTDKEQSGSLKYKNLLFYRDSIVGIVDLEHTVEAIDKLREIYGDEPISARVILVDF